MTNEEHGWSEYKDLLKEYKKKYPQSQEGVVKELLRKVRKDNQSTRLPLDYYAKNVESGVVAVRVNTYFPWWTDAISLKPVGGSIQYVQTDFEPFKSPGMDGIFPAMMQNVSTALVQYLITIYEGFLKFNYVPTL